VSAETEIGLWPIWDTDVKMAIEKADKEILGVFAYLD
jgi:hypothetical protein